MSKMTRRIAGFASVTAPPVEWLARQARRLDVLPRELSCRSGQLIEPLAEPGEADRNSDAFFGFGKNDEVRLLAGFQQSHELLVHAEFGDAAVRDAIDEAGGAKELLADLQAQSFGQQQAQG